MIEVSTQMVVTGAVLVAILCHVLAIKSAIEKKKLNTVEYTSYMVICVLIALLQLHAF